MAVRVGRRPPSVRLLEMESDERRKSGPGRWPREGGVENSEANDDEPKEGSTLLLVQISGSKGHGFEQGERVLLSLHLVNECFSFLKRNWKLAGS